MLFVLSFEILVSQPKLDWIFHDIGEQGMKEKLKCHWKHQEKIASLLCFKRHTEQHIGGPAKALWMPSHALRNCCMQGIFIFSSIDDPNGHPSPHPFGQSHLWTKKQGLESVTNQANNQCNPRAAKAHQMNLIATWQTTHPLAFQCSTGLTCQN